MKLNPAQVKEKFGPMFAQRFLAMVDREKGIAEIIETCAVRGTGVEFIDLFENREGRIGALAAIALSEERTEAAALYNDCALPLIKK